VDSQENVYVADELKNQIYVYDANGNPLDNWGSESSESGDRASKKTLVYRSPFSRILQHQYTTREGVPFDLYLKKVGARDTSADGDLNGPMSLRFDSDDNLYISDSFNHRVQVFAKDGTFLRKFGEHGDGDGQLNLPWGLDLDSDGCVYVADWKNARVQKFSPEGDYMATFGAPGSGEGELERPSSVAVDKDGDVYVTDWGANRLKIYEPDGTHMLTLAGDAEQLPPWQQARVDGNLDTKRARMRADLSTEKIFKRPVTVRVDDEGRIIVLEAVANRLQIYVKEQDWIDPPFNQ
jgi:DNA-binding beta-propeller fold protein YncE